MKRVDIKGSNGIHYHKMFLIENLDDIQEYHEKVLRSKISDAMKNIMDHIKKGISGHHTNKLAAFGSQIQEITGKGSIRVIADVMGEVMASQIKAVCYGNKLAINSVGGYFPLCEADRIIEIKQIVYSEADIHLTKFEGGKHWYARVGEYEVIEDNGNKHWNTEFEARRHAIRLINKLNKQVDEN